MRKMLITTMMSAFCASAAFAQTTPTTPPGTNPPAATKPTPKVKAPETPRSAESIECSKQADAKGLHGKPRQTFRANCIKGMRKSRKALAGFAFQDELVQRSALLLCGAVGRRLALRVHMAVPPVDRWSL